MKTTNCAALVRRGLGFGRKHCGIPATHHHPIYGDLCGDCATTIKNEAERMRQIRRNQPRVTYAQALKQAEQMRAAQIDGQRQRHLAKNRGAGGTPANILNLK